MVTASVSCHNLLSEDPTPFIPAQKTLTQRIQECAAVIFLMIVATCAVIGLFIQQAANTLSGKNFLDQLNRMFFPPPRLF